MQVTLGNSCDWIAEKAGQIEGQAAAHGAVLLRGLPLATPEDFDAAVAAFGLPNFTYEDSLSNAVRKVYTRRRVLRERGGSPTRAPPETTIFLHHEMAQTPVYPSKLFFFCQKAAEEAPPPFAAPACFGNGSRRSCPSSAKIV